MFFLDLLFVLVIAVLLTAIFGMGFRRHRDWSILLVFFLILFFGTWAVGAWVAPVGYTFIGVEWIPFVLIGLLLAFLLAALIPPARPPRTVHEEVAEEAGAFVALNIFFWILLIGFIISLIVYYV